MRTRLLPSHIPIYESQEHIIQLYLIDEKFQLPYMKKKAIFVVSMGLTGELSPRQVYRHRVQLATWAF